MKIRKILKKCTAGILALAIGASTLASSVSAANTSGVSIGYTWNTSVNPYIKNGKSGASGCVGGQYIKAYEQICRFCPSTTSDWAFCIEPAKSMQGTSYKDWYTQYGFTKYDTFDLTQQNAADTSAYWKKIGGTSGSLSTYMGLVQYYGYSSHKIGNYYAATQLLIWEMVLGLRGHTHTTFSKCTDVLWNDFTYPSGGWCTKSGVETAYNEIVSNVKNHYKLPSALSVSKAAAKDNAAVMKYNVANLRYEAKVTIPTSSVTTSSLTHNFSTTKSAIVDLVKGKFKGTYGTDYGVTNSISGTNTVYTIWSKERQFTSSDDSLIFTTNSIAMQLKSGLSKQETLFANSYYQTCLLSTKLDPVTSYIGLGSYNEPNLTVEKTFTNIGNNAITGTELSTLLGKTTFVVSCNLSGKKYYVQADKNTGGTAYVFSKYVSDASSATKFKTLKNSTSKGTFTINDLPTSVSEGRSYTVTEYSVPDSDRYEKLSKSVTLPSPTSDFTKNAGTKTVKLNNSETSYDAKFGTAVLDKSVINGDGKALSTDNGNDISALSGIYKSTKFVVGYWGKDSNGKSVMKYISKAYMSAKNAFEGDLADINNLSDTSYITGDGRYYLPTKLDSDHKVIFDTSKTSADISQAYVFSTGYNYSGTETCDYFGQVFLNLLPLTSLGTAKEIVFIEVNGASGYGYDENAGASNNLSTLTDVSSRRNICGILLNDTGKSFTVTDYANKKYVIGAGKYYPVTANKLENNKLHSQGEITNKLVNYSLVLAKKDSTTNEVLAGATYGLYNSSKKLLKTAVTGNDGKAKFDYNLLPNNDYYVKEISAPDGYALDNEYHLVNRANAQTNDTDNFQNAKLSDYNYTANDKPFTLKIELNKYDIVNNISIAGIVFDVKLNGKNVGTITTDKKGYASIGNLSLGKLNGENFTNIYTITERASDKYLMLDENGELSRSIQVKTTLSDIEDNTNPVITYTADIPNTLQLVDLTVNKVDEFGNKIKGVSFNIVPTKDVIINGITLQKKGESVGTIVTDEKGQAKSTYTVFEADGTQGYEKTIPIYPDFEYELVETYAPAPYVISEKSTKFTAKSEVADTLTISHSVTVKNDVQKGKLEIYKVDSETKLPLADAEFVVCATEEYRIGNTILHRQGDTICTMTTDKNGYATTGEAKMYVGGKYTLTEIKAPYGYSIDKQSKSFEFSFAGNTATYSKAVIDFGNTSQKGRISVTKTGNIFSTVNISNIKYTPVFASGKLSGAVYEITALENIVTKDGTTRVRKGDVVSTITTDKNGYAQTSWKVSGERDYCTIRLCFEQHFTKCPVIICRSKN